MNKSGFVPSDQDAENLRILARWIRACLVLGAILGAGLVTMIVAGGTSVPSASAAVRHVPASMAAEKPVERSGVLLAHRIVY